MKGTIVIKPHPEEVIDVDPKIIENLKKHLKDEYKILAEKMFGIVGVGAIDCREEEELCEEFSVFDTPTIKIFDEKLSDDGDKYNGKITWQKISGAATSKMMNFVRVVHKDNYE